MTADANPRDLKLNFELAMGELTRWPIATTALMIAVALLLTISPDPKFAPIDVAVSVAGYLFGILGGKTLLLLGFYPKLHKKPFPGSHLSVSYVAFVPIFAFFAAFLFVLPKLVPPSEEVPYVVLVPFFVFSYFLFVIVFAGWLRMTHTMIALGRFPSNSYRPKP